MLLNPQGATWSVPKDFCSASNVPIPAAAPVPALSLGYALWCFLWTRVKLSIPKSSCLLQGLWLCLLGPNHPAQLWFLAALLGGPLLLPPPWLGAQGAAGARAGNPSCRALLAVFSTKKCQCESSMALRCGQGGLFSQTLPLAGSGGAHGRDTPDIPAHPAAAVL